MSFFKKVEAALKDRQVGYLKHLEFYHGQDVKIYNIKKDEYSRVYGRSSGAMETTFFTICAIVINNDVIPLGPDSAGAFDVGTLITSDSEQVEAGQVVELNTQDNRSRRYSVKKKLSYGSTTDVFHVYEILAIGD